MMQKSICYTIFALYICMIGLIIYSNLQNSTLADEKNMTTHEVSSFYELRQSDKNYELIRVQNKDVPVIHQNITHFAIVKEGIIFRNKEEILGIHSHGYYFVPNHNTRVDFYDSLASAEAQFGTLPLQPIDSFTSD